MLYRNAKKLHNGDEVIIKSSGYSQYVVDIEIQKKMCLFAVTMATCTTTLPSGRA